VNAPSDLGLANDSSLTNDAWDRLEAMAQSLADAVDAKGGYTPSHSRGVAKTATLIGAYLDIRGPALMRLRLAGLLHDVGKLRTPDEVLLKPGALTDAEYEVVKVHPIDGWNTLIGLGLKAEATWVLHHHERANGTGYPSGLAGNSIPLGARILAVADAYDCMTTPRVYARARPHHDAMRELHQHEGDQFDGDVVDALERATSAGTATAA
jgi:HD-GYP domain-containing protein (c-di-GMP phosphodiesterase class II)